MMSGQAERRDFHLFIDEFHNFTTDSFAAILAREFDKFAGFFSFRLGFAANQPRAKGQTLRSLGFGK